MLRQVSIFALQLVFAAGAMTAAPAAQGTRRATVSVAAETTARTETLTLGDIGEVRGADQEFVRRLRAIALGYAPDVGAIREISREKIALAISAAGFSSDDIILQAPPSAHVKRAAAQANLTEIKEAVERKLLSGLQTAGATARVSRLDLPSEIAVPAGAMTVEASLSGVRNLFTPFSVSIELRIDGRVVRRFTTTAELEAFAPVLVAARDLLPKARLREGDYRIEVKRLERDPALYLREPSRLRGVSLTRSVSQGEAVTGDLLVPELVVFPGDAVRIIGESGAVKIIIQGEARASGRIGDHIQVKNLQSGVLLQALIVDEGLVSVHF